MYLARFQAAGKALAANGLITGSSGNLSIRIKDKLIITRHGSILSNLSDDDLIETVISSDDSKTPLASWELPVHRAIYLATATLAIVHAHPPYAVALSLADTAATKQADSPVIGESCGVVAGVLADEIAQALKKCPLVMVRGHGSFAIGETLDEALDATLQFEKKCKNEVGA
jgi:L-fuculose-phosphate aldolase